MKFSDQGIIIDIRSYGENSAIVKLLTKDHGICRAFVKSAKSKKAAAIYQIGNLVSFEYRSRIDDNLGSLFAVDLECSYMANIMFEKSKLDCVRCLFFIIDKAFWESEVQDILFTQLDEFLTDIAAENINFDKIVADYIRLELSILNILGYGVDLTSCAVKESNINLAFVSPKSARAVSYDVGLPYAAKLLPLPAFLIADCKKLEPQDLTNGLKLSGYFLAKHIFEGDDNFVGVRSNILKNISLIEH